MAAKTSNYICPDMIIILQYMKICQAAEVLVDIPADFSVPPSLDGLYQFRIYPLKHGSDEGNVTYIYTVLHDSSSNLTLPFTVYGIEPSTMYCIPWMDTHR